MREATRSLVDALVSPIGSARFYEFGDFLLQGEIGLAIDAAERFARSGVTVDKTESLLNGVKFKARGLIAYKTQSPLWGKRAPFYGGIERIAERWTILELLRLLARILVAQRELRSEGAEPKSILDRFILNSIAGI